MAWSTPSTWVAGAVLTAAQLNQQLRDNLNAIFPLGAPDTAWTAYTPTFVNLTVGSGSLAAAYTKIGRTVHYRVKWTFGAGSAVGTGPTFTLPVAPAAAYAGGSQPVGDVKMLDSGTTVFSGTTEYVSGSTVAIMFMTVSGANIARGLTSATLPMTWAVGDTLFIAGTYESAT